jgi:FkbM family methyltransferase
MQMPGGIVYGFEMDDLNFALLKKNIAINNCTNVEVHNLAVSDSSGTVSYKRDENRPNPGFYLDVNTKDEKSTGVMSVHSVTLDEFIRSKEIGPDVIKIDVEGAEMNVLMGMRQTLNNYMPILFLELHPFNFKHFNTSTSAILSFLIGSGYQVFEIEDLRLQETSRRLKPLRPDSVITGNAMLYATTRQESRSKAA